jgi:hypothetical protein
MKSGARYRSQVCATEVIVVRPADVALSCGGQPMIEFAEQADASLALDPAFAGGSQLGKRYTDGSETLELLVTKPGDGTLAADGVPLTIRAAKALPSSD